MFEIDGSYGEGGGQILRNAIGLSNFINEPVKITNIRANRPNPGIKAQHYVIIKSIEEISNAETKNLEIGSSKLTFIPGKFKGGDYKFDIGTAGSITLVFQALILATLKTENEIRIKLSGGTDVKWSPSWDYFEHVFYPIIKKIGVKVDVQLIKRGYYPKGGGEAIITIHPGSKVKPIQLVGETEFTKVKGIVNIGQLSKNISKRIKHSAIRALVRNELQPDIKDVEYSTLSAGTGITIWTDSRDVILGASVLGERGLQSEEIGKNVVANLLEEINSQATIDIYAFDQVLPYMALAKGESSCVVRKISNHAQTNMWLIKQFL
ncbi:MAG: RNA 3'-terminal phosphate cyclase, partial [Thermoplasmatales archaeon]